MSDFATLAKVYWDKTVVEEVYKENVILAALMEAEQLEVGGQDLKGSRRVTTGESRVQPYGDDTIVTATALNTKAVYNFQWKAARLPVLVTEREMLLTKNMMEVSMNFVADKMDEAREDFKIYFDKRLLGLDGTVTDSSDYFQGIREALTHDLTYGALSRATTVTNSTWQGASLDDTFADQADTYPAAINTVRKMAQKCRRYRSVKNGMLKLFLGPDPFLELKGQVEGQAIYNPKGAMQKYGFESYTIDNIEVVQCERMTESDATGASRWAYMLNLATWKFRIHPERNFSMGKFVPQDEHIGGKAVSMAMLKIWGNCYCTQPNANIWVPVFGS